MVLGVAAFVLRFCLVAGHFVFKLAELLRLSFG